jgi:hypothetical protein
MTGPAVCGEHFNAQPADLRNLFLDRIRHRHSSSFHERNPATGPNRRRRSRTPAENPTGDGLLRNTLQDRHDEAIM